MNASGQRPRAEGDKAVSPMTWRDLERADPELAAACASRLQGSGVAYLATVDPEGAPRVHPVTPIVGEGRLFIFMEPTSPKGADLKRGSRFALHSAVADMADSGELAVVFEFTR